MNDPGKVENNFFSYAAMLSHIGMFSFLQRECTNLQEGLSRKKMHLHAIFKACFCVLSDFYTRLENNNHEKFTILHVPHILFLCYSN